MMGYHVATKKILKQEVGRYFTPVETSMFGNEYKGDGVYTVVGPNAFNNRKWYANVTVKEGKIVKVV